MSYRQAVREAFEQALVGATPAGNNVLVGYARPIAPNEMPALLIWTGKAKRGQDNNMDESIEHKLLQVVVEVVLAGHPNQLESGLDAFCHIIERTVRDSQHIAIATDRVTLDETDYDITANGGAAVGVARLDFICSVFANMDTTTADPIPTSIFINEDVVNRIESAQGLGSEYGTEESRRELIESGLPVQSFPEKFGIADKYNQDPCVCCVDVEVNHEP